MSTGKDPAEADRELRQSIRNYEITRGPDSTTPEGEAYEATMGRLRQTLQRYVDANKSLDPDRQLLAEFTVDGAAYYRVTQAQYGVLMLQAPENIRRLNTPPASPPGMVPAPGLTEQGQRAFAEEQARLQPGWLISQATLDAIQAEATRAHARHGDQSMAGPSHSDEDRFAILAEEGAEASDEAMAMALELLACSGQMTTALGRVARELNEIRLSNHIGTAHLVRELIQAAAMAATWIEALGRPEPVPVRVFPPESGMDNQAARDNGIIG